MTNLTTTRLEPLTELIQLTVAIEDESLNRSDQLIRILELLGSGSDRRTRRISPRHARLTCPPPQAEKERILMGGKRSWTQKTRSQELGGAGGGGQGRRRAGEGVVGDSGQHLRQVGGRGCGGSAHVEAIMHGEEEEERKTWL